MDVAGSSCLLFGCGDLPADAAVLAAGHEPNGYFWEGVLQYLAGGLLTQVELDPEAGMFLGICFIWPQPAVSSMTCTGKPRRWESNWQEPA
jgi:hypothetical protein